MSFPQYGSYRASNVDWLRQVPSHWTIVKLSRVVDPHRPITYGIVQAGPHVEGGVPYIRPADMDDEMGIIDQAALLRTSPDIADSYKRSALRVGDLVCSIGPSFGKLMVVPPELEGANLTQGTARIAVLPDDHPRFVFWVLRAGCSVAQWESCIGGATFRALNLEPLGATAICRPPKREQRHIADFLDHETAKIDALIEEQRRLIELLREKRQAVISHAVTKGLDPNAPIKESGVEWMGEVPAHWEVTALKRHWIVTDCKHVTAEFVEAGVPVVSIREVQSRFVDLTNAKETTDAFFEQLIEADRNPCAGDLIFTRNATVGEVAQVAEWHPPFAMGQDVCLLRRIRSDSSPDYMWYVLKSLVVAHQLANLMIGSTFKRVNVEEVRNLITPIPPASEQVAVSSFLDREVAKFDALTAEGESAITLLEERRSALITAAVTGKIDVRGLVPAQAEAA